MNAFSVALPDMSNVRLGASSSIALPPTLRVSMTRAILIAFFCTFFSVFNIPVFWPILVLYFIILFGITMKRQIMVRLRWCVC